MFNLTCEICDDNFISQRSFSKFCSEKCRTRKETIQRTNKIKESRIPIIKKCLVCNDEFTANIRNPYQIYCSPICLSQAMNRRAVDNGSKKQQYIKTKDKYLSKKKETDLEHKDKIRFSFNKKHVLERDGYKCTKCGKEKGLVVHHKDHSGSSETPNNGMDNLTTLCRSCHMRHHTSGENNAAYIHLSKEQILQVRSESSSWAEVARKFGIRKGTLLQKRRLFEIF